MKQFLSLYILLLSITGFAQGNQSWGSYFSYYNTVGIAQGASRVYAASESAIFSQNTLNGELNTTTSVDGLKADVITAIHHSNAFNRTLIGNANGLLLVINPDNTIAKKIDIVQETTVAAAKKRINHIDEANGLAYISCDFGVAVFNLATLEFGDTYYLGPSGAEISVTQTAVSGAYIYAATNGNGIRRALLSDANLNDYNQWIEVYGGFWNAIISFADSIFAIDGSGTFYRLTNSANPNFSQLPSIAKDLREANGYMVATSATKILVYDSNLLLVSQINTLGLPNNEVVTFTCATVVGGKLYIGTAEKGVYSLDIGVLSPTNITPNGPLRNSIFSLEKSANNLWAVFGGYSYDYEPDLKEYGVSKYTANTGWKGIPYADLSVFGPVLSISDITINPNNEKEVYLNSFASGLLKLVDDVPDRLYNVATTSGVLENEQLNNTASVRINGGTFDSAGNLWMMNTRVKKPLKELKAGGTSWQVYSFEEILAAPNEEEYGKMVIDKNGTKWIPTYQSGLIAYNETLNKYLVIKENEGLPVNYVKSLAIDKNNRLWIGTVQGLRIISSVDRFLTDDELTATSIVFLDAEGVASELMYEQAITDIEVDGSNNKWFGTGAGAFLVSPDGQSTLFQFSKENSPLPSNNINDIEIDDTTGEVFFATDRGMVSYKGANTAAADDLSNVYVYPNPVRPGFEGDVKISGLVNSANVKITDIEGNLVYETTSEGGTVLWDTTAFGKYKVASGVYMIFVVSEDAEETKVKKVMVIRGN